MKLKILAFIVIISCVLSVFSISAFAAGTPVVDISRPEGNEIVSKDIFSICGTSIYGEATIELYYKDKDSDQYKPLENTDGESVFNVGKIFGKDIKLNKGENYIKILAYTKSTKSNPQNKEYIITYTEAKEQGSFWEKALNWFGKTDEK
jgi:hypothetical protein